MRTLHLPVWLALACVACGGSKITSSMGSTGSNSYLGTFKLINPDTTPLHQEPGYDFYVTGGSLAVNSDYTWKAQVNFRLIQGSQSSSPSWNFGGTYKLDNGSPTFFDSGGNQIWGMGYDPFTGWIIAYLDIPPAISVEPDGTPYTLIDFTFTK